MGPQAAEHLVQVAFGAEHLLGAEGAVFVVAAGLGEGDGEGDRDLAAFAVEGVDRKLGGDLGFGGLEGRLGDFQLAALAIFVDDGGFHAGLGVGSECALHEGVVLLGLGLPFFLDICHRGLLSSRCFDCVCCAFAADGGFSASGFSGGASWTSSSAGACSCSSW